MLTSCAVAATYVSKGQPKLTWVPTPKTNCYIGHGGTPLSPKDHPVPAISIEQCEAACATTAHCSAFVTTLGATASTGENGFGECYLRSAVTLSNCVQQAGYDTYLPIHLNPPPSPPPPPPPSPPPISRHGEWARIMAPQAGICLEVDAFAPCVGSSPCGAVPRHRAAGSAVQARRCGGHQQAPFFNDDLVGLWRLDAGNLLISAASGLCLAFDQIDGQAYQAECTHETDRWEVAGGQIQQVGVHDGQCLTPKFSWKRAEETNCYDGSGGTPLTPGDKPLPVASVSQCEAACTASAGCTAIVTDIISPTSISVAAGGGLCYLRSAVKLSRCEKAALYDTYTLAADQSSVPLTLQPCELQATEATGGAWSANMATLAVPPVPDHSWVNFASPHYSVNVTDEEGHSYQSFVFYSEPASRDPQAGSGVSNSFTSFSFSGKVTVTVRLLQTTFGAAIIRPLALGSKVLKQGPSEIQFEVTTPYAKLSLEFDDIWRYHTLLIFADPLEKEVPAMWPMDGSSPPAYFPPGEHRVTYLPESNTVFYLAPGSFLSHPDGKTDQSMFYTSRSNSNKRIQIRGRGVISGKYSTGSPYMVSICGVGHRIEGVAIIEPPQQR